MPLTVDELLEALPEVGLRLWMLDQSVGGITGGGDGWHASLYDPAHPLTRFEADGATPVAALAESLRLAGVNVEDVPPWE